MRPRMSAVDLRVLAATLLVAIPVLIVGAALVITTGQSRLQAADTARLAQMAEYTAGAVDAYVFRQILDAALLGRVPEIRRAAAAGTALPYDADRARTLDRQWTASPGGTARSSGVLDSEASRFLADLVANDPVYREVLVTDRYGRLAAASNATTDYMQDDEEWWIHAYDGGRGRVDVSDVRRDESTGVYALEIAVPILAPAGRDLVGIMKIVADSREMLAGIAGLELGTTSEAMLVRPNGAIVFRAEPYAEGDRFFGADLLQQQLEQRAAQKLAPATLTFEARSDKGTGRIVAVAPSQLGRSYPELPWMVALSLDRNELVAPFRSLVAYLILVAALTGVAVLAIALWFSMRLATPTVDPAYDMHLVEHPRMEEGAGKR